jgi:hypothetical protein
MGDGALQPSFVVRPAFYHYEVEGGESVQDREYFNPRSGPLDAE